MGRLKTVANNVMLYIGLIGYTAIGAKVRSSWKSWIRVGHILFDWQVFQWLELPSELERLETNQALLLTNRVIFLDTIVNNTSLEDTEYHEVRSGTSLTSWPWSLSLSARLHGPGHLRGGHLRGVRGGRGHREQGVQHQLGLHPGHLLLSDHSDHHRWVITK